MKPIPTPLNSNEELLYGINKRLEALIDQMSSLLEHIAKSDGVPVEENVTEIASPVRKARAKRGG